MLRVLLTCFLSLSGIPAAFADSKYVYLFSSAKARAISGLERQEARRLLADQDFARVSRLRSSQAISQDEYEQFWTAATVAIYDLEIARLKAKQAAISLDLVLALARNGQRIPLCRRKRQTDENTVSRLLKRPKPRPLPAFVDSQSGTRIEVREQPEPPKPPEVEPPRPPEPPPPVTPEPPKPPEIDPPEPPAPSPGSKPGPNPEPKPPPGGGGGPPPPK